MFSQKSKLVVVLFLALAMTLGLIAGVGAQRNTLFEEIRTRGKIRVGYLPTCPPFGMYDEQNQPVGFDVDLSNLLAEYLGVELELIAVEPGNRLPYLKANKVDLIIGTLSRTAERTKSIDYSVPYVIAGPVVVVRKEDEEVKSIRDLAGKKIGTIPGIVGDIWARKLQPQAKFVEYRVEPDQLLALRQKKVRAIVQDITIASTYVDQYPNELKIVGEPLYRDYIAIGIKKGEGDLKDWVDWFIFEMHNIGKIHEIWEKWFTYAEPDIEANPFF